MKTIKKNKTSAGIRLGLFLTLLVAGLMAAPPTAQAVSIPLNVDLCSGGCGTSPFGLVTLTQNGTTVDFSVTLNSPNAFIHTGASGGASFLFNTVGVVVGDITIDPIAGKTMAALIAPNTGPTGIFSFGITCSSCGNGGGPTDQIAVPIAFHVANATIAEVSQANSNGIVFAADIISNPPTGNGNTGLVASGNQITVPEMPTLSLMGLGLCGIVVTALFRKKAGKQFTA
jgi:hypothetical protein